MPTDRAERFQQGLFGAQRKFPWSWQKTAAYVIDLKKMAQELAGAPADTAEPVEDKEDIIRGLLQVHQDQQATVAAAEQESRSVREELDQARQSLHQQFQQLQQQQGQMQQLQMQSQQAVQQAQMQAQQLQMTAGPQIQQAQQQAAMAGQEATQAKIQLSQVQQTYEQTRRAVLDYKQRLMEVASQDPVTMAEAQKMQQAQMQQQQMMVAQQQQQQAMAQQAQGQQGGEPQAPEQGQPQEQPQGQPPQGAQGKQRNPLEALSSMIAGHGERAGIRRAMTANTLMQGMQQGQQQGQGGIVIPEDSLAGMVMKQGSAMAQSLKALQVKAAQTRPESPGTLVWQLNPETGLAEKVRMPPLPTPMYQPSPAPLEPGPIDVAKPGEAVEDPTRPTPQLSGGTIMSFPAGPSAMTPIPPVSAPQVPQGIQITPGAGVQKLPLPAGNPLELGSWGGGFGGPAPIPAAPTQKTAQDQVWGPADIEAFKKLVPPLNPVQVTGEGPGWQDVRTQLGDAEIRLNPATLEPAGPSASASIQRPAPVPVPVPAPIQPPTPGGLGSVP